MKLNCILSFLAWAVISSACAQQSMDQMLDDLYHHTVPLVNPDQLANWQENDSTLVLLDTRSSKEFQVSHLNGAKLVNYDTFSPDQMDGLPKASKVIVYCSVGYRSERIGEKMQDLGFKEVYNLYGGIFNWKNQGRQVINQNNQPTDSIHAYSPGWGKWLKHGIKVYD